MTWRRFVVLFETLDDTSLFFRLRYPMHGKDGSMWLPTGELDDPQGLEREIDAFLGGFAA